jgi:hypothetical protein
MSDRGALLAVNDPLVDESNPAVLRVVAAYGDCPIWTKCSDRIVQESPTKISEIRSTMYTVGKRDILRAAPSPRASRSPPKVRRSSVTLSVLVNDFAPNEQRDAIPVNAHLGSFLPRECVPGHVLRPIFFSSNARVYLLGF